MAAARAAADAQAAAAAAARAAAVESREAEELAREELRHERAERERVEAALAEAELRAQEASRNAIEALESGRAETRRLLAERETAEEEARRNHIEALSKMESEHRREAELLRKTLTSQHAERLAAAAASHGSELLEAERLAHSWREKYEAVLAEAAASAERLEGALLLEMGMKEDAEKLVAALREEVSGYERLQRLHSQEVHFFEREVEKVRTELREAQRAAKNAESELSRQKLAVSRQKQEMESIMQRFAANEIKFYSMPVESTRQAKEAHMHWNKRGLETNPGKMEGGLTAEGRVLTKAAWVYFRHAARILTEWRIAAAAPSSGPGAALARRVSGVGTGVGVGAGPNLELLKLEFQSLISAANMMRKLDDEAALAEYGEIHQHPLLLEHANQDDALRKVLGEAQKHHAKAEQLQRDAQARARTVQLKHMLKTAASVAAFVTEPTLPTPFSLHLTALSSPDLLGFDYEVGKASYRVDLSLPSLERVAENGFASFGRITPPMPLVSADGREFLAGNTGPISPNAVPPDAALFAWAFPLAGARGTNLIPNTPEERAVVNGAFVYFNDFSEVLRVSAVSLSAGGEGADTSSLLMFAGPKKLTGPLFADGPKLRATLIERGLCNPATMPALRDRGVDEFWWLAPAQTIAEEDGSSWPHGAFVYLYPEKYAHLDCIFTCGS
mmetsp:Transcript_25872/g.71356  ORF Transcript_25872/g.71356 Transcript_25872/m.71356 type:complete len:678 (+) Transcript_25872:1-2034(+)